MNTEFWRGRRVFLTGHTGFKGSWLSIWLQNMGAELTGFALPPSTDPSLFELASVASGMTSIFGDVRSLDAVSRAMLEAQPEIVIHMAAQPLVRASYEDPVQTYSTNVMGTVNTLEAARHTPSVRAILNVTTDKCYENKEWHWGYRESDSLGGYDPYSSSKACSELISAAYRSSFFNVNDQHLSPVLATARAGNVIGGGDWSLDRLIPDILAAFSRGCPVSIRNPGAIRPWQHVLEPLRGYLMLAEKLILEGKGYAEAWNFGPDESDARPVSWIVEKMSDHWGIELAWDHEIGRNPHEAAYLKLDVSKARARLNWYPKIDLNTAIGLVVDWTKSFEKTGNAREVSLAQIAWYESRFVA